LKSLILVDSLEASHSTSTAPAARPKDVNDQHNQPAQGALPFTNQQALKNSPGTGGAVLVAPATHVEGRYDHTTPRDESSESRAGLDRLQRDNNKLYEAVTSKFDECLRFERQLADARKQLEAARQERQSAEASETRLKTELHELKQQLRSSNDERRRAQETVNDREGLIAKLKDSLSKSEKAEKEISQKYSNASTELMRLRESTAPCPDDFFVDKWESLRGKIEEWADSYFTDPSSEPGRRDRGSDELEARGHFADLTEDFEDFFKDPQARMWLVQAFVWKFIEMDIFDRFPSGLSDGMYWAPSSARPAMQRLENFLRPGTSRGMKI
jgi:hypothetical protein